METQRELVTQRVTMAFLRLDGVGVQVVWGQSILYDISFFFIDMHPGEVNAIMARAIDVCLVDD